MLPVSLASQRAAREPVYAIREEPPRVPKPSRHAERDEANVYVSVAQSLARR